MTKEVLFRQYMLSCGAATLTTWLMEHYQGHDIVPGVTLSLDGDERVWTVDSMSEMTKTREQMIAMRTNMRVFGPSLDEKERIT